MSWVCVVQQMLGHLNWGREVDPPPQHLIHLNLQLFELWHVSQPSKGLHGEPILYHDVSQAEDALILQL